MRPLNCTPSDPQPMLSSSASSVARRLPVPRRPQTHPRVAGSVVKYLWVERETAIVSPSGIGVRRQRQAAPPPRALLILGPTRACALGFGGVWGAPGEPKRAFGERARGADARDPMYSAGIYPSPPRPL